MNTEASVETIIIGQTWKKKQQFKFPREINPFHNVVSKSFRKTTDSFFNRLWL